MLSKYFKEIADKCEIKVGDIKNILFLTLKREKIQPVILKEIFLN